MAPLIMYAFSQQHLLRGKANVRAHESWPRNPAARTPADKAVWGTTEELWNMCQISSETTHHLFKAHQHRPCRQGSESCKSKTILAQQSF